jgi:ligand-binding sensor domain-containing protein
LESTIIFSIVEADEGILWLGTGEGLVKYNTERDSYHLFETNLGDAHNQQEPRVCKVWYSDDGIWIVSPNTLARQDEASGGFEHFTYNHAPIDRLGEAILHPFLSTI